MTNNRFYYLDTLRGFLMILVVFMHSSQIFNPEQTWLLYSNNNHIIIQYLIEFTVLLSMPSFFVIAGFFTVISFKHNKTKFFLTKRVLRLLIPLLLIAVIFNSIQAYILNSYNWKNYEIYFYIINGEWIQHLWFLINLIVYTIISFITVKYLKKSILVINKIAIYFDKFPIYYLLFVFPILTIIILILMKFLPSYIFGINLSSILNYMPYFLIGVLLCLNKNLLYKFSTINLYLSFSIILLSYTLSLMLKDENFILLRIMYFYSKGIAIYFISSFAFTIFKKFFDKKIELISKISNASYTIYLIHHLFVVLIGIYVIQYNINFLIGFPIVFLTATLISYLIHRNFILKSNI